jgi:hypothetical protein
MTAVTLQGRSQMGSRLGCCTTHITVADVTVAGTAGIMRPGAADKSCRGVTYTAVLCGCNMRRIGFCIHTHRNYPVMAGCAVVHDTRVIERRTNKCRCDMAHGTIFCRRQMDQ